MASWSTAFDRCSPSQESRNTQSVFNEKHDVLLLPHIFCTLVRLISTMLPYYPPEDFAPLISDITRVISIPWSPEISRQALLTPERPGNLTADTFSVHAASLSLELLSLVPTFDLRKEANIMKTVNFGSLEIFNFCHQ